MKSIPRQEPRPLTPAELAAAKARYEIERESAWATHSEKVTPIIFPYVFGDGQQPVLMSFYSAPEVHLVIPFDSNLPLDQDLATRCQEHEHITSFREALDEIYDLLEETWSLPPGLPEERKAELASEIGEDEIWSLLIANGSSWQPA